MFNSFQKLPSTVFVKEAKKIINDANNLSEDSFLGNDVSDNNDYATAISNLKESTISLLSECGNPTLLGIIPVDSSVFGSFTGGFCTRSAIFSSSGRWLG